jgi:hypothetical protein
MRSEKEIRKMLWTFDEAEQKELLKGNGDNFKYGFLDGQVCRTRLGAWRSHPGPEDSP